jgi:anti-sigma28 factor (negative regulator of flagellin synthesis)
MVIPMNRSARQTTDLPAAAVDDASSAIEAAVSVNTAVDTGLTELETQSIREEKLAAIRGAIEKGVYDSDAILDKALGRMLERLEESENE